jgi:hypothetical protein
MPGEKYLAHLKFYVSGFSTIPFGIEWMRFDDDCPLSALIKSIPHIAFEVDDIDKALREHDFEIISEPGMPSEGVWTAKINDLELGFIREFLQEVGSDLFDQSAAMTLPDLCKAMHIARGPVEWLRPVNAGLLFFNSNPHRFFNRV